MAKQEFVVRVWMKDNRFNASDILKQWSDAIGASCSIDGFIEQYIPHEVVDKVVERANGEVFMPFALEPQLRLYAANYDIEAYDALEPTSIEWALPIEINKSTKPRSVASGAGTQTYLMMDESCGAIKIGRSGNPEYREKTLCAQMPRVKLIAVCPYDIERRLHDEYSEKRMRGEWFNLTVRDINQIIKENGFKRVK